MRGFRKSESHMPRIKQVSYGMNLPAIKEPAVMADLSGGPDGGGDEQIELGAGADLVIENPNPDTSTEFFQVGVNTPGTPRDPRSVTLAKLPSKLFK